jgi:hypothetical protein
VIYIAEKLLFNEGFYLRNASILGGCCERIWGRLLFEKLLVKRSLYLGRPLSKGGFYSRETAMKMRLYLSGRLLFK